MHVRPDIAYDPRAFWDRWVLPRVGADGATAAKQAANEAIAKGASEVDAATYGAAGAALAEGQGMWAWGQMAQAQNAPTQSFTQSQGTLTCPAGFLYDPANDVLGFCVAPNGMRVRPYFAEDCKKADGWWRCDLLVLYMLANHPNVFTGPLKGNYLVAGQKMIESFRALDAFHEGQWPSVKTSARALAHAVSAQYFYEETFPKAVDHLTNLAALHYDLEKKPPAPSWQMLSEWARPPTSKGIPFATLILYAGIAAAGVYALGGPARTMSAARSAIQKAVASARRLVRGG